MSTAQTSFPESVPESDSRPARRSAWIVSELVIGYALILAVIWTSRPLQHWLYWGAIVWFAISIMLSFPGWRAMGVSAVGFRRSVWVVGVALFMAAAATFVAGNLGTLHRPHGLAQWVLAFGGYTVWALAQQLLLQGYFLLRLVRVLPSATWAAVTAASVFALAHLPNPILAPVTLIWGLTACLIFLKSRNIWPLAIAHAIFGICIAITIPGPLLHNMRVGLGYITYRAPHPLHLSKSDHTVSTVEWVNADAPTRLSARHALP